MTVRTSELRQYTPVQGEEIDKYHLRNGDLLFCRYNGNPEMVGNCGVVRDCPSAMLYPDKLIRVRFDNTVVDPHFVEALFTSLPIRRMLEPFIKTAAGQHGISGADLKSISFPLPDIADQRAITSRVHEAFLWLNTISSQQINAGKLLLKLDQTILSRAFNGELSNSTR